jgi:hypothetical protein
MQGFHVLCLIQPTDLYCIDVVYLSVPIVGGEAPEPLIEPYLNTVLVLANVSEPLFKLTYVQDVTTSPSSTSKIEQLPIFVSPAPPLHLTELSDYASSAAESLFFRVVDHLKAKNPLSWATEEPGDVTKGGDVFTEIKVPMWPPLEGPREDEGGEDW